LDWRKSASETLIHVRVAIPGNDLAFARNKVDHTLESDQDRIQVFVNIGVVEFHRGQNHCLRKIMEEFGALIEEGSIVFVAFQNEMFPLLQGEATAKVFGDTSNQKRRVLAR